MSQTLKRAFLMGLLTVFTSLASASEIKVNAKDPIYPEGIAYSNAKGLFFLSSIRLGQIGSVTPSGSYELFDKADDLISVVGVHVDDARNRLIACVSDPGASVKTSAETQKKIARLAVYDLDTKKRLETHDLHKLYKGEHFCNDVVVTPNGDIYVTDSFSPVIYKVSKGKASLFFKNKKFDKAGEFNLNGIIYHPSGYFIVARYNDGTLWKIPTKKSEKFEEVKLLNKEVGADGLIYLNKEEIVVIQNLGNDKVVRLKSIDGWKSAQVVKTSEKLANMPTTGVVTKESSVYVLESKLNILFDPSKEKTDTSYVIQNLEKFE